jgi:hypothetical protein
VLCIFIDLKNPSPLPGFNPPTLGPMINTSRSYCDVIRHITDITNRSLFDAHEMNAYRAGHICLSVCMIRLEDGQTVLEEIDARGPCVWV